MSTEIKKKMPSLVPRRAGVRLNGNAVHTLTSMTEQANGRRTAHARASHVRVISPPAKRSHHALTR